MDWVVGKFGFDERLWRKLEQRQQNWLALSSALGMLSCLLFAIGGGYFAFVSAHGHGTQWFVALFIFALTLIIAFNFRRLFVLMGGYPLHQHLEGLEIWRPNPVRLVLITLMAVFFSQPLALLVTQSNFEKELNDRIELKINYFELKKKTELKTRIDEQTLELLRLQDELLRLPITANSADGKAVENSPSKNNRKVLEQSIFVVKNSSTHEICREGGIENRQLCFNANVRLLENRKKSLENAMIESVPVQVTEYRQAINASGLLTDRWQLLWQNKILAAIVSFIFVILLVTGDFMRDMAWLSPLRSYENLRHEQANQFVKARFDEVRIKTANDFSRKTLLQVRFFNDVGPSEKFL